MQAVEDDGRGLVDTVMDLLGIDPSAIGENDNLAGMGIDSMQARGRLCHSPHQCLGPAGANCVMAI